MKERMGHQRALITGASKGIGYAIAEEFVKAGIDLIVIGRDLHLLEAKAQALRLLGDSEIMAIRADVTDHEGLSMIKQYCDDIDILVNNAGAVTYGSLVDFSDEEIESVLMGKLRSYTLLSKSAFEGMKERGSGVILNIIGTAGVSPRRDYALGSMTNAALIAMTRALGLLGTTCGVRVVGINPGRTETERATKRLQAEALQRYGVTQRWRELVRGYPGGRLARPQEIAACARFLCSADASYINATSINVDGGGDINASAK